MISIRQKWVPSMVILSMHRINDSKLLWLNSLHNVIHRFSLLHGIQVELREIFNSTSLKRCFSGWVDTPAVRSAMPSFYAKMQNRLRTPEQGADTLVWLCCLKDIASRYKNGEFFQDRTVVSKHLPLAWTKSSVEDDERFIQNLDQICEKYAK